MAAVIEMTEETLENRVIRLESDVAHIRTDVADIKADLRQMRDKTDGEFKSVNAEFKALHKEIADLSLKTTQGINSNKIWLLLVGAAILSVVAKAFGWLH